MLGSSTANSIITTRTIHHYRRENSGVRKIEHKLVNLTRNLKTLYQYIIYTHIMTRKIAYTHDDV